jgi:two-component system invasion response regulator UvrY
MIKILIADDHTIVREGLKQIFVDTPDIVVGDEAGNGQDVLKKVEKNNYDIVLLDISLPGRSGLDVLKQLKSMRPELPVLILSIHPEEQYAVRSIRAGASGYLTKESASDELIKAIRKIFSGGKYITNSLAERIAVEINAETERALHEMLSDREYQVLCLIASGKTTRDIAKMLCLSAKTISTHRDRILRKMKMSNNAQLIRYALKHNLVD